VIHTPGHASNHLCYKQTPSNWLFTGDHIINGSTVVIDPPDGNMTEYLQSLQKLKGFEIAAIAPGHGEVIEEPCAAIDRIIEHRLQREAKVAAAVAAHPDLTSRELVSHVYDDVGEHLHDIAERSLLAHLEKLELDERVVRGTEGWRPL
jgi:glyoxylase-like metal-dependent hydrolase (beta-lactamase superfamily II)